MALLVSNAAELAVVIAATLLGFSTGSGRRSASAKLNMTEVAPIPMAKEQTAMAVNARFLRNISRHAAVSSALETLFLRGSETAVQFQYRNSGD